MRQLARSSFQNCDCFQILKPKILSPISHDNCAKARLRCISFIAAASRFGVKLDTDGSVLFCGSPAFLFALNRKKPLALIIGQKSDGNFEPSCIFQLTQLSIVLQEFFSSLGIGQWGFWQRTNLRPDIAILLSSSM